MFKKNHKNTRFIIAAIIAAVFVFAGLVIQNSGYFDKKINIKQDKLQKSPAVYVIIDFGNNNRVIVYDILKSNPYDALKEAATKDNLIIEEKKYDFGTLVTRIGDKENSKDNAWFYKINGKAGDVSSDNYILKNGDKVEWIYEKIK
jgi:hypothetical protein